MTPHKQLFHHKPEDGVFGDCYRSSIACLLDLKPEEVPHEHRRFGEGEMRRFMDAYLEGHGLALMFMAFDSDPDHMMQVMAVANPGMYYLLSGTSRTGCNHVVIARDTDIVWDTSLTNAGIVGRCDDGMTYLEWLVPRLLIAAASAP